MKKKKKRAESKDHKTFAIDGHILTELPDRTLLERARTQWQMGEWQALTALAEKPLANHPDRGKLEALAAAGFAQTGQTDRARRHARWALDWGCDRELLARILIGGVYNSLGRAASLHDDELRAERFFETAVATVSPNADTRILGRVRHIHEKARLGQLPEAARLIFGEVKQIQGTAEVLPGQTVQDRISQLERTLVEFRESIRPTPADPPEAFQDILDMHRIQPDRQPQHRLLICCHHKSGTNFLLPVFRKVAKEFNQPIWLKFYDAEPEHWRICLHQHARINDIPETESFRGIHQIRHPMGLIYSAMLYHGKTCKEPWAHVPLTRFDSRTFWAISTREGYNQIKDPDVPMARKQALMHGEDLPPPPFRDFESGYDFKGRTYIEMMEDMSSEEDRLRFEMWAYSQGVIRDMISFPSDCRFFRIRLEDISRDRRMTALQEMVQHLGFAGSPAAKVLEIAAEHCLWNNPLPNHATTGVSDRWRHAFDEDLKEEFHGLFGWADQALGYM